MQLTIKQTIVKALSKPALAALDWLSMVRENEELRRTIRTLEHRVRENGYGFTRLEGTIDTLSGRLGAAEKGHSDALGELHAANEALGRAIVERDAFEERCAEHVKSSAAIDDLFAKYNARIADLESQLSARANWRPRREMPEGWRVASDGTCHRGIDYLRITTADERASVVEKGTALALAAYLDAEEA